MRSVRPAAGRTAVAGLLALVMIVAPAACAPAPAGTPAPGRTTLWGLTVDDVTHAGVVASLLAGLPERPTTRVYFDVRLPARHYAAAVARIGRVSVVMDG